MSLQQILGELPLSNWKTKDPYLYSEPGSGVSIKYATAPGRLIPLLTFCLMYVVLLGVHLALMDLYTKLHPCRWSSNIMP